MVSLTGRGDFHRVPVWDPWALPTPIRPAISQEIEHIQIPFGCHQMAATTQRQYCHQQLIPHFILRMSHKLFRCDVQASNLSIQETAADGSEFTASLVYVVSSRAARAT